jgi:hypothetical protein
MKIPDGYILIAQGCSDPIMCVGSVYNRVDLEPNLEPFYGEITIRVKQ